MLSKLTREQTPFVFVKRQCAYYGKKYGKTLGKLKEFTEEIEIFAEDKVFPPVLFMEAEVGRGAGQNMNLRLRGVQFNFPYRSGFAGTAYKKCFSDGILGNFTKKNINKRF